MAEAVAAIGLLASIATLIEISAKTVSRLREFSSKTVEVPESFSALSSRLPLLTATLKRIQNQSKTSHLPNDVTKALRAVVDTTVDQIMIVYIYLRKVLPSKNASKFERVFKALRSLPKDEKVQQAVKAIHKNIDFLVLHQTTRHVDMGDRILEELAKMSLALSTSSEVSASLTSFGKCLGNAPTIAPDAFVGRKAELEQLRTWLSPDSPSARHHVVSIVGMGGMGKTQLSLAHVQDCGSDYTSVFWLNAKDETSLKQSMAELSSIIFPTLTGTPSVDASEDKEKIEKVRQWLSMAGNDQWLLILDNYDDPNLPGARSSTGYDIRPYFPVNLQGSIIITSRSTKLTFSTQLKLQKIDDDSTSVAILSQRCGRDLSSDASATELVQRLGGLPLALATAGGFLSSIDMSCTEYLTLYKSAWMDLMGPAHEELLEYEARTLSSTWTVSLDQIRLQDEDAAKLLTFFAYFGNNDIWYELLQGGANYDVPWLDRVTQSKLHFQRTMSRLVDYSLVDVVAGSYQVHPCLHDWLLEKLNRPPDPNLFIAALICVSEYAANESSQKWVHARRLFEHVERLELPQFSKLWTRYALDDRVICSAALIGDFDEIWEFFDRAERMYQRALDGYERTVGPEHASTLEIIISLGILSWRVSKLDQAEEMYQRALKGCEETLGPEHRSTLDTVHNLGLLYRGQGKLDEAEEMYQRALHGKEKVLGPEHKSTLNTVNNLGVLYWQAGKLDQAEEMYRRALDGCEKNLGPEHTLTLDTVQNLGLLYKAQGKLDRAEEMYLQALRGYEKALGTEHRSTLSTVNNLGLLYRAQGKHGKAQEMFKRTNGRHITNVGSAQ